MTDRFKKLRAEAFLRKATEKLKQPELSESEFSEVEAEYRQALEALNTDDMRRQVQADLETYLAHCQAANDWWRAEYTRTMLQNLGVTDNKKLTSLKTGLLLSQAKTELAADHLDAAFACLKDLDDKARTEQGKSLVKTYFQDKARQGLWFAGDAALKRLVSLLAGDEESLFWRVNWLFMWAKTLFPHDEAARKPARAKCLCQKILGIASPETPIIDLLSEATTPEKDAPPLCHQTYSLLGDILLAQTQTCLDLPDLGSAEHLFGKMLDLPIRPERQALITLAFDQARLSLQADQPEQVFAFLNYLKTELNDAERAEVKNLIYRFSRLYAGRDRWPEAKHLLSGLREWLNPTDEKIDLWLDDLNREWLAFVKAKRLPEAVSLAEIERQELEVKVADQGYGDAEKLKLKTQSDWANKLIEARLALGQMYLDTNKLAEAGQSYDKVLTVKEHEVKHEDQISQSLHSYGEYMLNRGYRDKAEQALDQLKTFDLAAPDRQTRPDPRMHGAVQRVILAEAWAYLSVDRVDETLAQLQKLQHLPQPWPVGQIKKMFKDHSQERCDKDKWSKGIAALEGLNTFLHDQESLEWLVDHLEQWGQSLKEKGDLERAAEIYDKAITYSRQATRSKAAALADVYSCEIASVLAQNCLDAGFQATEPSTAIDDAAGWYDKILNLREHHNLHEELVNEALKNHAKKLAQPDQWPSAYYALKKLDELYRSKGKAKYKTLFANWRRELVLAEIETWLQKPDQDEAFKCLNELKNWLDEYQAPQAGWLDQSGEVKKFYGKFYLVWLQEREWDWVVRSAGDLDSLLSGDSEVTGWKVQAHYEWGQALHEEQNWEEALEHYKQALAKVDEQQTVPELDIQRHALATRLALAQQYLNQDNLDEAIPIYDEALKQPGDHPDRAEAIRTTLKAFSDHLIEQRTPPDWKKAHQALDYLLKPGLDSSDVLDWRQDLTLREVKAILNEKNNVDTAFIKLETMPPPPPLDRILKTIEEYSWAKIETDAWEKSIEAFRGLEKFLDKNTPVRQLAAQEADKLGEKLEQLRDLRGDKRYSQGAATAYDLAIRLRKPV